MATFMKWGEKNVVALVGLDEHDKPHLIGSLQDAIKFVVTHEDSTTGLPVTQKSDNNSSHVLSGGPGGAANAAITTWPFTLATHTGVGAGTAYNLPSGRCSAQVSSDASHTGTSLVDIEVSNDNVSWAVAGTLSVTGNSDTATLPLDSPWAYIKSNCTQHGDSTNNVTTTINI